MNCYHHPQTASVGLCKNCSRGLCQACAADEGFGLACKDRCETEVKAVSLLIQKNKEAWGRSRAVSLRAAVFYGLMGFFFLLFAYIVQNVPVELRYLFGGFGTLLLIGALFSLINAKRMKIAPL